MQNSTKARRTADYAFAIGAILAAGGFLLAAGPQSGSAQAAQAGAAQPVDHGNSTGIALTAGSSSSGENGTGKKFSESLVEPRQGPANYTAGGNFTLGQEGFGNETALAKLGLPHPIDTSMLRMHIINAMNAHQNNDAQGAVEHIVLALEEIEVILAGNATTTTTTAGNNNNATASTAEAPSNATESSGNSWGMK